MQCPHCYKTDLHPKATRCHHFGGEIEHKQPMSSMGCGAILGFLVAVVILGLIAFRGVRIDGENTVILVIAIVCVVGTVIGAALGASLDSPPE